MLVGLDLWNPGKSLCIGEFCFSEKLYGGKEKQVYCYLSGFELFFVNFTHWLGTTPFFII